VERLSGHGDADARPAVVDADPGPPHRTDLSERRRNLPPWHPSSDGYRGECDDSADVGDAPHADSRSLAPLSYRQLVPVFAATWEQIRERWPARAKTADHTRPGDPPGMWRGSGDRKLYPDQNAEADQVIAGMRRPEQSITKALKQIESDNTDGAALVGLEHNLKGTERLKEKIADKIAKKPGSTVADTAATIWDAVRYTFQIPIGRYVDGYLDLEDRMTQAGFHLAERENRWIGNVEYKGVNTHWMAPDGGKFELQVHTPESFHAKEEMTHDAYERLRTPGVTRAERYELMAFQRAVSSAVPIPIGIERITSYKEQT
jgi:hypothetical protein